MPGTIPECLHHRRAAVPDPVTSLFHTRHIVRIGLFTELDTGLPGSRAATLQALGDNRPHDVTIEQYSAPSNFAGLRAAREILRRAAADRIDLVHVATSGPLAVAALILAGRSRLPDDSDRAILPPPCASAVWKSCVRTLAHHSFRVLVTSVAARNAFLRAGVCASKIVDLASRRRCVGCSCPRSALRHFESRWGVSDARPAVIYAGAISSDRGARRLLSLELGLRRTRPMHQLIVVGDGPARHEVQARCPNAIFTGVIPHAEMPAVLASGDLFVCPSDAVSTNLAVLEAQASGLPVVVMENGSARERVGSSAGVVCRSSADFIVETAAIVRTDARRKAMGIAAREYAMRQDWSDGLMAVYAEYRAAAAMSAFGAISSQPSFRRADAFSSNSAIVASTWRQSRIMLVRVARSSCSHATQPGRDVVLDRESPRVPLSCQSFGKNHSVPV